MIHFRLVPFSVRSDIAMLGVIHRASLGCAPEQLRRLLFNGRAPRVFQDRTRSGARLHSRQLPEPSHVGNQDYVRRSLFGYVSVYNLLPEHAVLHRTTTACQSALQTLVINVAKRSSEQWTEVLSPRHGMALHPLRHIH